MFGGSADGDGDCVHHGAPEARCRRTTTNGYRDTNNRICNVITHKALEVGIIIGGGLSNIIECRSWS